MLKCSFKTSIIRSSKLDKSYFFVSQLYTLEGENEKVISVHFMLSCYKPICLSYLITTIPAYHYCFNVSQWKILLNKFHFAVI